MRTAQTSYLHCQGHQGTLCRLPHHGIFSDDGVVGDAAGLQGREGFLKVVCQYLELHLSGSRVHLGMWKDPALKA